MEFAYPTTVLRDFIIGYYIVEGDCEKIAQRSSIWSRPFLIINYGDDFLVSPDIGNAYNFHHGLNCSGVFLNPGVWGKGITNLKFIAVEFLPQVAAGIFHENMTNLVNSSAHNLPVFKSLSWLCDALNYTANNSRKIELLNIAFIKYFSSKTIPAQQKNHEVIDIISKTRGQLTMTSLKKKTGLCRNTLIHRFKEITGVSPGHYAKIIRLEFAIAAILNWNPSLNSIHDLIYDLGYYDQSHFIHEIKKGSGCTPLELNISPGFDCLRGVFSNRVILENKH